MTQLYSVKKHNNVADKLAALTSSIALVIVAVGLFYALGTINSTIAQLTSTEIDQKRVFINRIKPIFESISQLDESLSENQRTQLLNQASEAETAVRTMQAMPLLTTTEGTRLALSRITSSLRTQDISVQDFSSAAMHKLNDSAKKGLLELTESITSQALNQQQLSQQKLSYLVIWCLIGFVAVILFSYLIIRYLMLLSRYHNTVEYLPATKHDMESIFLHLPESTLVLDIAGNIIYANKQAYQFSNYSEEQLAPMHIGQLISHSNNSLFDKKVKESSEQGTIEVIVSFLPKDRPVIPTKLKIWTQLVNDVPLTMVTMASVAVQQQEENEFNVSYQMLNHSELLSNIGSWRWDFGTDKLFWSDQVYKIYGYESNELDINNDIILSLVPQQEREDVSDSMNESMIFGKPYDHTHHIIKKDGTLVMVRQQAVIVRDTDEKAIGMMGCLAIVEQESIACDQQLFITATDAMIITDSSGKVERVNPAFVRMTGYSENNVVGNPISQISRGPYFDEEIYTNILKEVASKQRWEGELWNSKANGIVYPTYQYFEQLNSKETQQVKYLCRFNDISEQKHVAELLSNHSIENLTKLPSRNVLFDRITHAIKRHERDNKSTVVILLSLDANIVPDKHLLQCVSSRLKDITRSHDSIARFGVYEFIIVLEGITNPEDAYIVSDKIAKSFETPFESNEAKIGLACNIGIAMHPLHSANDVLLLNYADAAMQYAKANDNANIQVFNEKILKDYNETQHLNNQLQRAIDLKELSVQFQPIMDLNDQAVSIAVAHIRWHHAAYNNTQTYQFIDAAKNGKLREPLHFWLLSHALEQATQWPNHDLATIKLQIKVVKEQLNKTGLALNVKALLNQYHYAPSRLILELEAAAINELCDIAQQEITSLKALGVTFNVSSFDGPQQTPIEKLSALEVDSLTSVKRSLTDVSQGTDYIKVTEQLLVAIEEHNIYPTSQAWIKNACTIDINPIASEHGITYLVCDSVPNDKLIMLAHLLKSKSTA